MKVIIQNRLNILRVFNRTPTDKQLDIIQKEYGNSTILKREMIFKAGTKLKSIKDGSNIKELTITIK